MRSNYKHRLLGLLVESSTKQQQARSNKIIEIDLKKQTVKMQFLAPEYDIIINILLDHFLIHIK
uniref:Uncharacterized protein n=1 Tax=Candidozyma auris TaxID=498019 RepID=A0A0L0P5L4_CANAR